MTALAATAWLEAQQGNPELRVVDASWHMPAANRNAAAEYAQQHIPGAVFADIDAISDPASPYPHMLPEPAAFAQAMGALGIGNHTQVVVYDTAGLFSAARLWWMLRVFGHERVRVLDGGLPQWLAEGRKVGSGTPDYPPAVFTASFNPYLGATAADVLAHSGAHTASIVDARSGERFSGSIPEPRAGLRSGHIPGSCNVPFGAVLNPDKTMKSPAELKQLFEQAGVDWTLPVITSCGSGVTACVLALALHECGKKDVAVYDGSWAEWGAREELPVAR